MNVKAQGLIQAGRWIERNYGRATLETTLARCAPETRVRYESAIAINWHPMEELVDLLEAAAAVTGDARIAEKIGAASAEESLRGIFVKVARYFVTPDYLLRRAASVWSRFNDEGSLHLHELRDDGMLMEVRDVPHPSQPFCALLTGWAAEGLRALGAESPSSAHVECRARGDARCVWDVRWRAVAAGRR